MPRRTPTKSLMPISAGAVKSRFSEGLCSFIGVPFLGRSAAIIRHVSAHVQRFSKRLGGGAAPAAAMTSRSSSRSLAIAVPAASTRMLPLELAGVLGAHDALLRAMPDLDLGEAIFRRGLHVAEAAAILDQSPFQVVLEFGLRLHREQLWQIRAVHATHIGGND
jgi:hypothetical protein